MAREPLDHLPGTLDLLILRTLAGGAMHGYGISQWIRRRTEETFTITDAALYPGLRRLEKRGAVRAEWGVSENGRRARYYELTAEGRRELEREASVWGRYVQAVCRVLDPRPTEAS